MSYLWIKALHIVATFGFISGLILQFLLLRWAAMSALPRSPEQQRAIIAMQKWDTLIIAPAMFLTWGLGIFMAVQADWFGATWLSMKLIVVVILSGLHGIQSGTIKRLSDAYARPVKQLSFVHPGLFIGIALPLIVILVVVKPFGS